MNYVGTVEYVIILYNSPLLVCIIPKMITIHIVIITSAIIAIVGSILLSPSIAFATHTTTGANFWFKICKSIDLLIAEPCEGLVANHDTYNQGLSLEGWRVTKCFAGGALAIYGGHPELLTLGPVVGCASTTSQLPGLFN